jgi:hypothetical protein
MGALSEHRGEVRFEWRALWIKIGSWYQRPVPLANRANGEQCMVESVGGRTVFHRSWVLFTVEGQVPAWPSTSRDLRTRTGQGSA